MSNYTKTTDFEAKDSLPTGDSGKIIRGAEFETEFDAISTAIATKADTAGPTFTGTLTFETISDGTIGVTAFVDEDDMSSDSATLVPTQQSVKAYVDSVTTELNAQDLDFQADSGGALNIDLDSETMTFTGGTGIDTSGSGNTVTFDIDSTVTTLTGTQTLTNKTLTAPVISGNLTTDGTIDGRDVATDGAKLDGIEAGATADQTDAEIRAAVEAATDSNVFTDADHTKLDGIEASATADQTDAEIRAAVEAATDSNVFTDADHTKLDGIEASATADQTDAEIRAAVEAATDSNVFTDADHSKLDGIEALADVTDTTNVTAAGALMDSELTNLTAVKSLDQGVATTDSPTFAGLTTTADVSFGDNDKAVFGAGNDLEIYHTSTGNHSIIEETGGGNLVVRTNGPHIEFDKGSTEYMARMLVDGAVELYYDSVLKLATTSTGIDVTGTVTADGLTVDGGTKFSGSADESSSGGLSLKTGLIDASISNSTDAFIGVHDTGGLGSLAGDLLLVPRSSTGVANSIQLFSGQTTPKLRQKIADNGDISFYEDTGTTAKLFWDASAERLGLGTTSPLTDIHIVNSGAAQFLLQAGDSSTATMLFGDSADTNIGWIQYDNSDNNMNFRTNNAERMRIDSSGNLLVGTTSSTLFSSSSETGTNITSQGGLYIAHNGTNLPVFNRITSDGDIVDFRKNGLVVGSIGTQSGNPYIGGTNRGIRFDSTQIIPVDMTASGSNADNSIDIGNSGVRFKDLYLSGNAYVGNAVTSSTDGSSDLKLEGNQHIFRRGSAGSYAEQARIDSSGNLLVGTTNANIYNTTGDDGVAIKTDNIQVQRANNEPLFLNRTGSDGVIASFRKDGSSVGSIGTEGGRLQIGLGASGLYFYDSGPSVLPWNVSSNSGADNSIDLGSSGNRWKDLYLSGGVYLGGTGSANKLDDYEEGTWTPSYGASSTNPTVTHSVQVGRYVKVGGLVTCFGRIKTSAVSTQGAGSLNISGLPFTAQNVSQLFGGAILSYVSNWVAGNAPSGGYVDTNSTTCYLTKRGDSDEDMGTGVNPGDLSTGSSDNDLIFTITYKTTA
jgi:hypothetical protein